MFFLKVWCAAYVRMKKEDDYTDPTVLIGNPL